MKKSFVKAAAVCGLSLSLLAGAVSVSAAYVPNEPEAGPFA